MVKMMQEKINYQIYETILKTKRYYTVCYNNRIVLITKFIEQAMKWKGK